MTTVPVEGTVNSIPPATPIGGSIGESSIPVCHPANLSSPLVVDVGDTIAVDVGPCGTVADGDVIANINLTNIDVSTANIGANTVASVREPVPSIRKAITRDSSAVSGANISRQCGRADGLVHSQKVAEIASGRAVSTGRNPVAVAQSGEATIACIVAGQSISGASFRTSSRSGATEVWLLAVARKLDVGPRSFVGKVHIRTTAAAAPQLRKAGSCGRLGGSGKSAGARRQFVGRQFR